MIKSSMPTSKCPMCGGDTKYDEHLLGKKPQTQNDYHAYCPQCRAFFSNTREPEKRVVVWEDVRSNIYPQDEQHVARLRTIIGQSMNEGNREKKEPSMCSEHSEDALTWSVFSTLEQYELLRETYAYFRNTSEHEGFQIYYWGYNDKYPQNEMIQEYLNTLNLAGEPKWLGGYSEPDILLFNPRHGLINIEVKYLLSNNDKLRDHSNQKRNERAQKMLEIGKKHVKKSQVKDWRWYELLRMWVPGCLVVERMGLPSFTLVNLLPKSLLENKDGQIVADMKICVNQDERFQFKQVTWEDFLKVVHGFQAIQDDLAFWEYIQEKPGINMS